ncbi:hypothetical protein ACPOLB_14755 [Rubrivivax sp. RP6-9]|uniref:hypothetical protein n=1 Tax=Rubrivivax sp. RP6-9 TaxID=3415750 RepID=UPI003CC5CE9C
MAKHLIFLVHGMGAFEPGWSESTQQQIAGLFGRYEALRKGNWLAEFEFREINYNHVFEAWRQQWRDDAAQAAQALVSNGLHKGVAKDLVDLAGQAGGDGFLRTHVLDVVLYRFLMPVAQEVWRSLQQQVLGHLKSQPRDDALHYSVIAHSLGTAVTYEGFHAMMTLGPGADGTRLGTAFRPDNVFLVANAVVPLWNRGGSEYAAVMAPTLSVSDGWCFQMANFGHALDPVARLDPFAPPDNWFSPLMPRDEVYLDVTLPAKDMHDENVHALEHYLSHPDVHVPMLRTLAGFRAAVSKDEHAAALADWRKKTLGAKALAKASDKLRAMLVNATADWSKEVGMLLALRQLAGQRARQDGES